MNTSQSPTFDQRRRQLGGTLMSPADRALEMRRLVNHLTGLGFAVSVSADISTAINHLVGEEEFADYRCFEGVAVSHASDDWWLLFLTGDFSIAGADMFLQPSSQPEDRPC